MTNRLFRIAAGIAAIALLAACATSSPTGGMSGGMSDRLTPPRLPPVDKTNLTPAQTAMLANRADYNIYKTLAHHPDLYARWSPLGQFLLNGSSLQPRHREIAMLRMGWLCQSEYEWSQHARIARTSAGLTDADLVNIAKGASAPGWTPLDRAILTMVDELRYDATISDATWTALRTEYSQQQVMEILFTAAQYQLVSMALNSLGVQPDPGVNDRLPTGIAMPAPAARPNAPRLSTPRIAPIAVGRLTPEQREIVKAQIRPDGSLPNLYGTMVNHPGLYGPRVTFGSYIQRDSLLPSQTRELLIMRTAWMIRAPYEWAHHVGSAKSAGLSDAQIADIAKGPAAQGWNAEQRALLSAADELRREAFISDATWRELSRHYDTKQMIEIVYTVGGYAMTGFALNAFGVQVEPGYPAMPG